MSEPKAINRGPIAWMAHNNVAANLLMVVILVAGLAGVLSTKQEVFPEFSLDQISIQVAYPGASPGEVEQAITLAVEERVRGLEGVKRVSSSSKEGSASVTVALLLDADPQQVLAEVKNEVDRISTFPLAAEEPVVSLTMNRRQVISLILSGEHELADLHKIAEAARMALLQSGEVTQVEVEGVPPLEIAVEVPRDQLERYGLTLADVSREIANASLEIPAGALDSDKGEIRVRVSDRRATGAQLSGLVLRASKGGGAVRLGDIAKITDGYQDNKQYSLFDGKAAIRLTAYRVGDETPAAVTAAVKAYAAELRATWGSEIQVTSWQDDGKTLRERMDLLMNNAALGLLLVLVILAIFLDLRLAFWVALGIPISFLGAFVLLGSTTLSINMISLFAFIVVLGMVVDDAIIVGERAHAYREKGHPPLEAAILAAREMAVPLTFAILTTVAAFMPLLFVPGVMGKIFQVIPIVVISVLMISLVESFFILPSHLGHSKGGTGGTRKGTSRPFAWLQGKVQGGLQAFVNRVYKPLVRLSMRYRYISLALSLSTLILTIAAVAAGRVPFNFFPAIEGDIVSVSARLPYGTSLSRTESVGEILQQSLEESVSKFGETSVNGVYTRIGQQPAGGGPGAGGSETGSHLIQIEVELPTSDERSFTTSEFVDHWRQVTGELVGVESLSFNSATGPSSGEAVAIQLVSSSEATLAGSATEITERLRAMPSLNNVDNGYTAGKAQIDFRVLDSARGLGFSSKVLAGQLRSAFFGSEALREQRGRLELKVMVRLPAAERRSEHDLEEMMVRSPDGHFVPLGQVASLEHSTAPTSIEREDGRRKVVVSAELAPGVFGPQEALAALNGGILDELRKAYPDLEVELVGQQREQSDTFSVLGRNYLLALFFIYALLAIPFRSYIQPLIIMGIIPFGFVGAIWGHALMGHGLSIMSMFGLIALSGVVVNDSLVLVDATNKARAGGLSPLDAVLHGGVSRFRPILLTSLTTFFGLMPMLAETSMQAQFLIPMAISLAFGVLAATVFVLLLVPALYLIAEDVRGKAAEGRNKL